MRKHWKPKSSHPHSDKHPLHYYLRKTKIHSSYRPISLTNCDGKVFSKVIALRLESVLPDLVSYDQTGFVQDRQSYFNLRRLFNIIYTKSDKIVPEAVVSLDRKST